MAGKGGGKAPGAGAVDKAGGVEDVGCSVNLDRVNVGAKDADRCLSPKVDRRGTDGGEKSWGEFARIETVLAEEEKAMVAWCEIGKKKRERLGGEKRNVPNNLMMARRKGLEGGAGVEGDVKAGEIEEMLQKIGIEGEAEFGERKQRGRVFGVVCGEHAGGCGGGLGKRLAAVEDCDAHSAPVKFEGKRQTDDAGSRDTDVGVRHRISLDGFRHDIVWLWRFPRFGGQ